MLPAAWPADLIAYLRAEWGPPTGVTRLSGIGGPGAYRYSAARGDVIVKCDPKGREARFYTEMAPRLRPMGVPVPALYWAEGPWFAVEAIPHALPRSRWVADPAVMGALAALHGAPPDLPAGLEPFRPAWTDEMTAAAVACVPAGQAAEVRDRLLSIREGSRDLFAPVGLISGDPNPTNWGMREDGSVVLFDWERFGLGAPALDLAITMPGLGTLDGAMEHQVAAAYPGEVSPAAIGRAKLWTIVEFLSAYAAGELPVSAHGTAARLAEWLPEAAKHGMIHI